MDVLDISKPEISASLLRLEADRRERRRKPLECIHEAYDVMARMLLGLGVRLTDRELHNTIPGAVLAAAVKHGWAANPQIRTEHRRRYRFNPFTQRDVPGSYEVEVKIPEAELTEQFGPFKVTPPYVDWWLGYLGGRIAFWEAEALEQAAAERSAPQGQAPQRDDKNTKWPRQGQVSKGNIEAERQRGVREPSQRPAASGGASRKRAARLALLKEYGNRNQIYEMDALARHLKISLTALYGMARGDVRRYSEGTLNRVLKQIDCSRAGWNRGAPSLRAE
jgi:hypothetical protein